jgi:hypothetical protein
MNLKLDKYHLSILTHLFNHGYIGGRHTSKDNVVKNFRKSDRGNARNAFEQLVKWNLILLKKTSAGEHIMLNPSRIYDIKSIISPQSQGIIDKSPVVDLVDPDYEKKAFHITEAQRSIKGVHSKYSYHRQIADATCIKVYIFNEKGENVYKVLLDSFGDPTSLLHKSIKRIDDLFNGKAFSRPEMNELGRDIIGNKQQLKAILDMLLFYKYVIPLEPLEEGTYYLRTTKALPKSIRDR